MYYSAKENEFYGQQKEGSVFIPDADAFALMSQKQNGGTIVPDSNGMPMYVPPVIDMDSVKSAQLALIEAAYQSANTQPIAYMGTTFQADANSQSLIADVLTASGGSLPAGFSWFDINNQPVAMTYAQLQGLAGAILLRGQPLFLHKQLQKAAIRAATDVATVESIVW